jgi:cytochrome c biogenesis protein
MWVRARRRDDGTTVVEVARLDRSSGGDPEDGADELADVVAALQGEQGQTGSRTNSNEEEQS